MVHSLFCGWVPLTRMAPTHTPLGPYKGRCDMCALALQELNADIATVKKNSAIAQNIIQMAGHVR